MICCGVFSQLTFCMALNLISLSVCLVVVVCCCFCLLGGVMCGFVFLSTVFLFPAEKANLPELTSVQLKKLRHLTVVTLATKSKVN